MIYNGLSTTHIYRACILVLILSVPVTATAADNVNPNQAAIDEINHEKALIEAQDALLKAQASLIKDKFPAFPEGFGKAGELIIEGAERDKFHVTARSAESFTSAAKHIAEVVKAEVVKAEAEKEDRKRLVLITDADRASIPIYWAEQSALDGLDTAVNELLGPLPAASTKEGPQYLLGIGTLLAQVAQFGQLVRTDRNLAFADSLLPDELLNDLVAIELPQMLLYPAGALDGLIAGGATSPFGTKLDSVLKRRASLELKAVDGNSKERASALISDLDTLESRLSAPDANTKMPVLLSVLRGELVDQYLSAADGRTLTLKVIAKGGASLKTTSIWRSDRLYASGGVVATYRLTNAAPGGSVAKAGVVVSETAFKRIPLD